MLSLRLHPAADKEALEAVRYLQEEDPAEAGILRESVEDAIRWARSQPLIFRCFEDDFRKVRVGKFRYSMIFRIRKDEVQILAVAHMSRRPGYWKDRATDWPK